MSPACLYRFFTEDGELLYVGCTANLPNRLMHHRQTQPWWTEVAAVTVEHFDTWQRAYIAEQQSINTERPRINLPTSKEAKRAREVWNERKAVS